MEKKKALLIGEEVHQTLKEFAVRLGVPMFKLAEDILREGITARRRAE